eukprot:NODE_2139_length_1282_cov_6.236821_g1946_i0.p1 GENE.NODE_2139_length_1282_cov_6.236821_g1946_i0~~NODE_2139_length_1282_cov_6.236821_g1946_i0.p1  ORF type:complete len:358 (-),score=83.15 NODE_2139_length_1282_cov_6.236821_g1946_i0:161-1234(-)
MSLPPLAPSAKSYSTMEAGGGRAPRSERRQASVLQKMFSLDDLWKIIFVAGMIFGIVTLTLNLLDRAPPLQFSVPITLIVISLVAWSRLAVLGTLSEQTKRLEADLRELRGQIGRGEGFKSELEQQVRDIRKEAAKAKESVAQLTGENEVLSSLIAQQRSANETTMANIANLEDDLEALTEENTRKEGLNAELTEQVLALSAANEGMRDALVSLGETGQNFGDIVAALKDITKLHDESIVRQKGIEKSIKAEHQAILSERLNILYDQQVSAGGTKGQGLTSEGFASLVADLDGLLRAKFEALNVRNAQQLFTEYADSNTNLLLRGSGWSAVRNLMVQTDPKPSYRSSIRVRRSVPAN